MNASEKAILLVEDDPNDIFFLQYAFETVGLSNPLRIVGDGQQAIEYLSGAGQYADREQFPFPCLVLLDLKIPVKMGLEVLKWIQEHSELHCLLVIVLTSSSDVEDVDAAYRLGARSFLTKPLTVEKRLDLARMIKHYWLELNEFPTLGGCRSDAPLP